ncbi:MAG: response regulator transcription factor [Dehalococcoidales bacterium]|nr:response regulator transcription factor [Dehalococcoidales bacterium]
MRVLIIEDDENIVESLSLSLRMRWPDVDISSAGMGEEGLQLVETFSPDIVVLDLGLPDINGFEVLRQVRMFSDVPIIILSVLGDEDDIVRGLEMDADDYIVKPFKKMEFLARVKSLVRRKNIPVDLTVYERGNFRVFLSLHHLYYNENKVTLTKSECLIFYKLIQNANTVVTYSSIARELWGDEYPGSIEAIRVYVQRLRRKIEEITGHSDFIETKSNMGYTFNLQE